MKRQSVLWALMICFLSSCSHLEMPSVGPVYFKNADITDVLEYLSEKSGYKITKSAKLGQIAEISFSYKNDEGRLDDVLDGICKAINKKGYIRVGWKLEGEGKIILYVKEFHD